MKIFVAHPSSIDFRKDLYEPIMSSDIATKHDFFLPQATDTPVSQDLVKNSDAMVVEVSDASTGSGVEMGWADAFGVPVLALHKPGTKVSKAVTYVTKDIIEYVDSNDLIGAIRNFLEGIER